MPRATSQCPAWLHHCFHSFLATALNLRPCTMVPSLSLKLFCPDLCFLLLFQVFALDGAYISIKQPCNANVAGLLSTVWAKVIKKKENCLLLIPTATYCITLDHHAMERNKRKEEEWEYHPATHRETYGTLEICSSTMIVLFYHDSCTSVPSQPVGWWWVKIHSGFGLGPGLLHSLQCVSHGGSCWPNQACVTRYTSHKDFSFHACNHWDCILWNKGFTNFIYIDLLLLFIIVHGTIYSIAKGTPLF